MTAKIKGLIPFICPAAILITAFSLDTAARYCNGFAEWYAESVYPLFVSTIGFANGLIPFSLAEWLMASAIAALLSGIVFAVIKLIKGKQKRKQILLNTAVWAFCIISSVYLIYTLFCGINYNRTPFSEKSGLITQSGYTAAELTELCNYLTDGANECAEKITADENGLMTVSDMQTEEICAAAMSSLGERYPALHGQYPKAKPVVFSELMSHLRILGIYSPFTIEANYNSNAPDYSIPFTACHELSHLKGFMREDEANYIAYLACRDSDNVQLRYSAYVQALNYSLNKLYPLLPKEKYRELYMKIHPTVRKELLANALYWENYETPAAEVSAAINDSYLKSQGQSDGSKSYGRFVDLMIYDFKMQNNEKAD